MLKSTTLDNILIILFGLMLLGLAAGIATGRVEIHLSPPTPVAETGKEFQPKTEEKLSTRTPVELFWIKLMEERGYKHISLPVRWDRSDWAEKIGLSEAVLFYRIRPTGAGGLWYIICFEHNLLETMILIDDESDDHTDRILVRESAGGNLQSAFEKELNWGAKSVREVQNSELPGYLSLNDFERPTPGTEEWSYLEPLFVEADRIISYLK